MNNIDTNSIKTIDKLIFFFMILFVLSLSSSIFVNQIGYYACLILLMIKWGLTRKNPFYRSGLEFAFIWFIAAEIISALLSDYQSAAFLNVIKRSLLLPVVFVTASASLYISRTKIYFKLFIIGTLVTCLIYLYHSYSYFTQNLFSQYESGPSVFQYPITSSEIMSFTVVFLFAFLINEKTSWRNKLLILAGFAISAAALLATYKRTGWLGAAFGMLVVLLMKKQWKILVPAAAAIIILFIFQTEESKYSIYNLNDETGKVYEINTEGRASGILALQNDIYVADDYNGILHYKDSVLISQMKTPVPVTGLVNWNGKVLTYHSDTRFILYGRDEEGALTEVNEFASPGFTTFFNVSGEYLYIMDRDSGLTIFSREGNSSVNIDTIRSHFVAADKYFLLTYSGPQGLNVYHIRKGIPIKHAYSFIPERSFDFIFFINQKLYTSNAAGISLYQVNEQGIELLDQTEKVKHSNLWEYSEGRLFTAEAPGSITELQFPSDSISIVKRMPLEIMPGSLSYSEGKIYTTYTKRNRLLSFVDPYHPTNVTRLNLWRAGLAIFRDYPLFGVGDIDLGDYQMKYSGKFEKERHGHLHNNFMHILATLGLFGLSAVLFIFIRIIIVDIKIYRDMKNVPFASSYSLGALGVFFAFLFSGLTELNFGDHEIITLVWFTFGLNLAFYNNYRSLLNNGN